MSIWGAEPYENDDAADWLADLDAEPSIATVQAAFDTVVAAGPDDYLEVTEAACAVAASAVLMSLAEPLRRPLLEPDATEILKAEFAALGAAKQRRLLDSATRSIGMAADTKRSELAQLIDEDPKMSVAWHARLTAIVVDLRNSK